MIAIKGCQNHAAFAALSPHAEQHFGGAALKAPARVHDEGGPFRPSHRVAQRRVVAALGELGQLRRRGRRLVDGQHEQENLAEFGSMRIAPQRDLDPPLAVDGDMGHRKGQPLLAAGDRLGAQLFVEPIGAVVILSDTGRCRHHRSMRELGGIGFLLAELALDRRTGKQTGPGSRRLRPVAPELGDVSQLVHQGELDQQSAILTRTEVAVPVDLDGDHRVETDQAALPGPAREAPRHPAGAVGSCDQRSIDADFNGNGEARCTHAAGDQRHQALGGLLDVRLRVIELELSPVGAVEIVTERVGVLVALRGHRLHRSGDEHRQYGEEAAAGATEAPHDRPRPEIPGTTRGAAGLAPLDCHPTLLGRFSRTAAGKGIRWRSEAKAFHDATAAAAWEGGRRGGLPARARTHGRKELSGARPAW